MLKEHWKGSNHRSKGPIAKYRVMNLQRLLPTISKPEQIFLQNLFLCDQLFHIPHCPNVPSAQEIYSRTRHSVKNDPGDQLLFFNAGLAELACFHLNSSKCEVNPVFSAALRHIGSDCARGHIHNSDILFSLAKYSVDFVIAILLPVYEEKPWHRTYLRG